MKSMKNKKTSKLDQILKKLGDHDNRFDSQDKKFDQIFSKLEAHDKKFQEHDDKFKGIINKLLDHDDQFEKMNAKIDFKFDQVLTGLDKITKELEIAREDRQFAQNKDKQQDERLDKLELVVGISRV